MAGPTELTEKQFWQQAEALVGLLDAYGLLGDERYWQGFRNVHACIFESFICHSGGGEWYERIDRDGKPIDAALGHAWKCPYHTVRSMIETVRRLRSLAARSVGSAADRGRPSHHQLCIEDDLPGREVRLVDAFQHGAHGNRAEFAAGAWW